MKISSLTQPLQFPKLLLTIGACSILFGMSACVGPEVRHEARVDRRYNHHSGDYYGPATRHANRVDRRYDRVERNSGDYYAPVARHDNRVDRRYDRVERRASYYY